MKVYEVSKLIDLFLDSCTCQVVSPGCPNCRIIFLSKSGHLYLNVARKFCRLSFSSHNSSSLRSKRFQSSYSVKVGTEAKRKKMEGGGVGEKRRNACPQTPRFWKMPLDISRFGSLPTSHPSENARMARRQQNRAAQDRAIGRKILDRAEKSVT